MESLHPDVHHSVLQASDSLGELRMPPPQGFPTGEGSGGGHLTS